MHSLHSTRRFIHFFLILAVLSLPLAVAEATSLLDVYLPDRIAAQDLRSSNLDIVEWHGRMAAVVAWPGDEERLAELGLTWNTRIENVEEFYRNRLDSDLDDMGGYATLSEINAWIMETAASYPELVAGPDTIGYTHEERPLLVFKLSANAAVDEDEPEIFLNSAIHAREVITPLVLMNFADLLLEGYGTDQRATDLLDSREIWFQLNVNPDGYAYNEQTDPNGGGMWRKNRYEFQDFVYGVDLNRNFPYMWGYDDIGSSPDRSDGTYRGPEAGSEPETQAMMNFTNEREFSAVLNYHSYSNLILLPWGYTYERPPNYDVYFALGTHLNETLGWQVGGPEIIYATNGGAEDWQEGGADYHMWTFTFEVGTGWDGFWPTLARRDELIPEQEEPLFRFCEMGANPWILMPAPSPTLFLSDETATSFTLTWHPVADTVGNVAANYDVAEMTGFVDSDDAESATVNIWDFDGFSRGSYGGSYAYYSGNENSVTNTLTATYPITIAEGDTLSFNTRFVIEDDYDYAYVQARVNGGEYVNLEGSITTNANPNGANQGNGITGPQNDWIEARFPLDEYAGQSLQFRFAYITDTYVSEEGFYVDDISPVVGFETQEMIAEAVEDTFLTVVKEDLTEPTDFWYMVRSIDEEGDISSWSSLLAVTAGTNTSAGDLTDSGLPQNYEVAPLYPNPFNPTSTLQIGLPVAAEVTVRVIDILGREVQHLSLGQKNPGRSSLVLDGRTWATGLYFVVVDLHGVNGTYHHAVQKAVIVK
ncbi:immune inhibitor A [bacterium]|nr:immune inhibitor A [bacterium]